MLTVAARRRARSLAQWNAILWALGNGLVSSSLVIYLAFELGASRLGLGVAMIRAAPQLAGLLRLGAPTVIGRMAARKSFCIGCYVLSGATLLLLPLLASPGRFGSANASLAVLVGLWCLYHLLEYLGTVALWSWIADLVPQRIRGRFLGRRDRWMVTGQAVGFAACGLFTFYWRQFHSQQPEMAWIGYAISAALGAALLISAVAPLVAMPGIAPRHFEPLGDAFRSILAPFADRRFLRLLAFGCWLSLANGITQPAQDLTHKYVGISLLVLLLLQTGMRCGQWTVAPWLGRLADHLGNRKIMGASLTFVAAGPLFYAMATPDAPGWIAGAWACWIAWAGLNVCLPNLMLTLAPRDRNVPFIAAYYATTGLCMAVCAIAAGELNDRCRDVEWIVWPLASPIGFLTATFLVGAVARASAILWLWGIAEKPK